MANETSAANMANTRDFLERAFNQGDLSAVDQYQAQDGIDHQEPAGTDFRSHLKAVITELRTAFPDLKFTIDDILAEGETVAFRSTMTGTHQGPFRGMPPTGKSIRVAHMHFVRMVDGHGKDLWHVWDLLGMLQQLGAMPVPQR